MKIEAPENANYAATIVRVNTVNELPNCDNVVGVPVFGYQAIVGKDTQVGDLAVAFTAETQLSEEFARQNNLHRHGDRNIDPGQTGYLEDNRRVKALKFRKQQSDALLMPLSSLAYLKVDLSELKPGDTFDKLGGQEVCRKYLVKQPGLQRIDKNAKRFSRVDAKMFPLHFDTDNYWRNAEAIPGDKEVIVTQKLHGTSVRIANIPVNRELKWYERLAEKVGFKIAKTEFAHVYGSRRVTKDANNPNQNHFYDTDLWSTVGKRFDDAIPEGYIVYGEIIGYTEDGQAIQKSYTYNLPHGKSELYVYRVAVITPQGRVQDLSWDQVVNFCDEGGMKHTPVLWRGWRADFDVDFWINKRYFEDGFTQAVPLSNAGKRIVDEGVCVRAEGLAPYILKAKSPIFLEHETKMLDEEAVDLEAEAA